MKKTTTSVSDFVEEYTLTGYTLFPVNGKTKKPINPGWRLTPYDCLLVSSSFRHTTYGVLLSEQDLVIDYDPRRDQLGTQIKDLWNKLRLQSLEELNTLVVETPSGGFHIYFKKPPDFQIIGNHSLKDYPAIDIKKEGGFVVGADSIGNNGTYTVLQGSLDYIAPAPQALLEYLKPAPLDNKMSVVSDDDATRERFIRYLHEPTTPPSIEGQGGNNTTYGIACKGKDFGLSEQETLKIMQSDYNYEPMCQPVWEDAELRKIVHSAYTYSQGKQGNANPKALHDSVFAEYDKDQEGQRTFTWDENPNRTLRATLHNTINFFQMPSLNISDPNNKARRLENPLKDLVAYNEFTNKIEFLKKAPWHYYNNTPGTAWQDNDTTMLKFYLSTNQHYNITSEMAREAVEIEASLRRFHPIIEWWNTLYWDGIDRLDNLFHYYCGVVDSRFTREISKNFLIGMVARVDKPGCQQDHMVVLEGDQGIGKTNFCRVIGGKWFKAFKAKNETDAIQIMQSAWLVEMADMAHIGIVGTDELKSFLTRTEDSVRLPYAHYDVVIPRQVSFIGTINPGADGTYLNDETGNRRFWTLKCGKERIKIPELRNDRDQLFAEALHRYRNGESWWIQDESIELEAQIEQDARLRVDPWYDVIADFLDEQNPESITTADVAQNALMLMKSAIGKRENARISNAMMKYGYKYVQARTVNGRRIRVWKRNEVNDIGI